MSGWRAACLSCSLGVLGGIWDSPEIRGGGRHFSGFCRLRRSGQPERERGRSEGYLVAICKQGWLNYSRPLEPRAVLTAQVLDHRRFIDRDAGMMPRDRGQVDLDHVLHSTTQDVF